MNNQEFEPKNFNTVPSVSHPARTSSWIGTVLIAVAVFALLTIAILYIWGEQVAQNHGIPAPEDTEDAEAVY